MHRKNSSESIELMFYAPSMLSGGSQQDQQSLAGSASVSKSIRSTGPGGNSSTSAAAQADMFNKYLTVYPEVVEAAGSSAGSADGGSSGGDSRSGAAVSTLGHTGAGTAPAQHVRTGHLSRKCSEVFSRRHRRRLERQSSLDTAAAAANSNAENKLMRNQSDTIATAAPSFLHSQPTNKARGQTNPRQHFITSAPSTGIGGGDAPTSSTAVVVIAPASNSLVNPGRSSRLQRHRSSETHDERLKHQSRGGLFQPILQLPHHSAASSIGALAVLGGGGSVAANDVEDMELGLVRNAGSGGVADACSRALQSWILGKLIQYQNSSLS